MFVPALALDADVDNDRRLDLRQYVDLPPILMACGEVSEKVQVVNIARRGFLARAMRLYRTNDRVALHFPDGEPCEARVVWCAKGLVGGRFVEGFDIERIHSLGHPDRNSPTPASRSNR